jgi:uncharacterized protein
MSGVRRYQCDGRAKAKITETGLVIEGNFSRDGLQKYRNADGSTRVEYRDPSEVFSPESMASFRGAPVIEGHTWVDTKNWKQLAIGATLDVRKLDVVLDGNQWAGGTLTVNEDGACKRLGDKLVEISVGYTQVYDPTPGVTASGERYDGRQTQIRVNHIGLGPEGWAIAGRNAKLTLDGNEDFETRNDGNEGRKKMAIMITYDGIACEEGSPTHVSLLTKTIEAERKKAADGETARKDLETKLTALKVERDTLDGALTASKGKVTELETSLKASSDPKKIEDGINEHLAFRDRVRSILGPDAKFVTADGTPIDKNELVKSCIKAIKPNLEIRKDGSSEYLEATLAAIEADRPKVDYSKRGDGNNDTKRFDGTETFASVSQKLSADAYGHK